MQSAQQSLFSSSQQTPTSIPIPQSTGATCRPVLRLINPTARPEVLRAALLEMARQGDCDNGRQLLQSGLVMPDTIDPVTGESALMLSAEHRQASFIRMLLLCRAPADQRRADGTTSLMLASAAGDAVIVQMLLQAGAAAGQASDSGISSLILAAWSGATSVVDLLLDAGAPVDHATSFGWTALMRAAQGGHVRIVETLLANGGDVERVDCNNRTALMFAAEAGHADTVQALVDAGADTARRDDAGLNAADIASAAGHGAVAQMLLDQARSHPRWIPYVDDAETPPTRETTRTATTTWTTFVPTTSSVMDAPAPDSAQTTTAVFTTAATTTTTTTTTFATTPTTAPTGKRREKRPSLSTLLNVIAAGDMPALQGLLATLAQTSRDVTARLDRSGPLPECAGPEAGGAFTPLMVAAYCGHAEMITALVDAGATVDIAGEGCRTALMIAAAAGHTVAAQVLVDAGADVTCCDVDGLNAAEHARAEGHRKLAKALSEQARSQPRYRSSEEASEEASETTTESHFPENTTSTASTTSARTTAATPALTETHTDDLPEEPPRLNKLLQAIGENDFQSLHHLLAAIGRTGTEAKAQLDMAGPIYSQHLPNEGAPFTPLMTAAYKGDAAMIKALVEAGATVNLSGYNEQTALMIAEKYNHPEAADMLRQNGALFAGKYDEELSAGTIAAYKKLAEMRSGKVRELRELMNSLGKARDKPEWISKTNESKSTLTFGINVLVVFREEEKLFRELVSLISNGNDIKEILNPRSKDVDFHYQRSQDVHYVMGLSPKRRIDELVQENSYFQTPLGYALRTGNDYLFDLLVGAGADINLPVYSYGNALTIQSGRGNPLSILSLVAMGAKVNYVGPKGETPLMWAAKCGQIRAVRILVEMGAKINLVDKRGRSALHKAVFCENAGTVEFLTLNGADLNQLASYGDTPLMYAARNGNLPIAETLIKAGAKIDRQAKFGGKTALIVAATEGHLSMVQLLLDHGAEAGIKENGIWTALDASICYKKDKVAQLLKDHIASGKKQKASWRRRIEPVYFFAYGLHATFKYMNRNKDDYSHTDPDFYTASETTLEDKIAEFDSSKESESAEKSDSDDIVLTNNARFRSARMLLSNRLNQTNPDAASSSEEASSDDTST